MMHQKLLPEAPLGTAHRSNLSSVWSAQATEMMLEAIPRHEEGWPWAPRNARSGGLGGVGR
eukprot:scaffold1850_cov194-Pinguiococcus_pyrenoidosus.AAC.21